MMKVYESEPYYIIEKARNLVKEKKFDEAEKEYKNAISILEKRLDGSDKSKAELWTTKAEYLNFRGSYSKKGEPFEDSRRRRHDAIRYLYKCSKLDGYSREVSPSLRKLINETIRVWGCIIPENNTHVTISCPIKIRNMGAGKFGFSVGMLYKRALCSICRQDVLDEGCNHVPGNTYDGKVCHITRDGLEVDHVAMTTSPKDPRCLFLSIDIPKKEFYEHFTEKQTRNKIQNNLPIVCSFCREGGIDPSEISAQKFFEMQGLSLEPFE